ncbi:hypothetical protein UY3_06046 [Chelonia mydas]|uniref:Uncharacterized protein n=1 Tax=Chelonia mydas TaxID=8469 RepID=M7BXH7_CHEMY|nr:hypothetical protein UY3_06046 [Chelonia mydas]
MEAALAHDWENPMGAGPRQDWPDLPYTSYPEELPGLPLVYCPEEPIVLDPPGEHHRDPGKAPGELGQFVYLPRPQVRPIAAPTGCGSPLQAKGGSGKRRRPRDVLAALAAASIGLEPRSAEPADAKNDFMMGKQSEATRADTWPRSSNTGASFWVPGAASREGLSMLLVKHSEFPAGLGTDYQ